MGFGFRDQTQPTTTTAGLPSSTRRLLTVTLINTDAAPLSLTTTCDRCRDPFKDTAGPSIHVLIKMLATITLVMAPLFLDSVPVQIGKWS